MCAHSLCVATCSGPPDPWLIFTNVFSDLIQEEQHHVLEDQKQEEVAQTIFETNWDESIDKFEDLNLHEEVLRGVYGYGFEKPSPIQQKAILPILQGRDTIAQVSQIYYLPVCHVELKC